MKSAWNLRGGICSLTGRPKTVCCTGIANGEEKEGQSDYGDMDMEMDLDKGGRCDASDWESRYPCWLPKSWQDQQEESVETQEQLVGREDAKERHDTAKPHDAHSVARSDRVTRRTWATSIAESA